MMEKARISAYCDKELWKKFLNKMVDKKGNVAISECLEEAIKDWINKK